MIRLTVLTLLVNLVLSHSGGRHETNFCMNKKRPGLFSQGCSSNITICNSQGRESWLLCPFDLVFDGSLEECVDYRITAECSAKDKLSRTGIRHLPDLPAELCESVPKGFHAATGCSSSVILCSRGKRPSLMECPHGHAYDNKNSHCVKPSKLRTCPHLRYPPTEVDECEGSADGFFAKEPCSSYFLSCSGGVSRIMSCPSHLIFDKKLKICEYPQNVKGCKHKHIEHGKAKGVCKKDGFFSYGYCSDLFYGCSNGRQIPMYCPAKLAFDESRQLCDYPMAVEACIKGSSGSPPLVEESWQTKKVPAVPKVNLKKFCHRKRDGFYAIGCSSEIISCVAGTAQPMMCPAHLVFDEEKQMCDYPENVPCTHHRTHHKERGYHHKERDYHHKERDYHHKERDYHHKERDYHHKERDYHHKERDYHHEEYGECATEGTTGHGPCENTFTNCVKGKAYVLACEEGYIYSETQKACREASKMPECSAKHKNHEAGYKYSYRF